MREKTKKFSKSRRFFLLTQKGIERFNESRFKSRKVKGRATSSENRKFFVAVMKGTLGVVKKMLTNGRFVNFTNPPLVNIFLTMPNVPFITATKNFLFSLEVALPFTFLLLKRLSLNLSIPFCVSKKNSSTL